MHTGDNIIKSIAIFATATILFNAIAPTLAQAAKHLQGAEVNATALVRDAYIAVTYYDGNNRERTARGWIDAIGETSFTIRSGLKSKTTIAYAKVLSVVMGKDAVMSMNAIGREIKTKAEAIQRFKTHNAKVRFKAPSLTKKRIVGEVVKMTQDTLLGLTQSPLEYEVL